MPVSVPPSPPPRPRMRPPRPWVPDDPPETVLPAWMYACREPHPPHRVVRPDAPRRRSRSGRGGPAAGTPGTGVSESALQSSGS